MEFGLLKSKIEKKLNDSYLNNNFSQEIKNFKKYVLENKSLSKAFHIYNELNKTKGFEKSFAENYVNECVDLYGKINFSQKSLSILENWVKGVKCSNEYKDIDTVLVKNTISIENILESKSRLVENLTVKESKIESINIPIQKMVEVANDNLKNYLSELNESELSEVKKYLSLPKKEIEKRYEILSEVAISKLEKMAEDSESSVKEKIKETIDKIKTDNVDSISLIKLKSLTENL